MSPLLLLVACAHREPSLRKAEPDLGARYTLALADAAVVEPAERRTDLRALAPGVEGAPFVGGSGRLSLVTWTGWEGYDALVGQETTLEREVWVTAGSDLQVRCRSWKLQGEALTLRLEQLLGLPPGAGKTRVVTLEAAPEDLFRPCPDPGIDDRSCELALPQSATPEHRAWFTALQAGSYGKDGYPWTRLGYTYDWGGRETDGLSEFVIRKGARVRVAAVTPTAAHCAGP